ncbi:MAG: serine/threonine-protein kinase [Gemmatimonadaceae bacterium]
MSAGTLRRSTLGNYRLVDFLGAGGMGEVYRASHLATGRVVAVKVLTAGRTSAMIERFRNEARIQSTLTHPHIVTLYEFFEAEGLPCIAMEYVSGQLMEQVLVQGPMDPDRMLGWFAQVVDAVGYVHQRGIVHRDLKSNNIKIDEQEQVKLLDFGIAKSGDSPKLTTDGSMIGTLHYLSPEQVRGGAATPASDIWALGVVLYEMATGRVPFESESLTGVMMRILKGSYSPPSRGGIGVSRDIGRIIARCLKVEPEQRYASAEALLTDVRALLEPPAPAPLRRPVLQMRSSQEIVLLLRRRGPLIAAATATVLAVAFFVWSSFVCCTPRRLRPEIPTGPAARSGDSVRVVAPPEDAPHVPLPPLRPVIIKVFGDGDAEVHRDGVPIGKTPLRFEARIGEWVSLMLRRPGHVDLFKRFQIVDDINEYSYDMIRSPGSAQPPHVPQDFLPEDLAPCSSLDCLAADRR